MKQNINEEVARMREMMGLEEQLLNKLKTAAQNVGQKINTAVQNVTQKPAPQPAQNQQVEDKPSKHYNELLQMFKDTSVDKTNLGFGFAQHVDENMASQMAYQNAIKDLSTKFAKTTTVDGKTISSSNMKGSFPIKDEASYGIQENGKTTWYHAYVVEFEKK